jgi:hypothetical protein
VGVISKPDTRRGADLMSSLPPDDLRKPLFCGILLFGDREILFMERRGGMGDQKK